jgi:hypothetical protein
MRERFTFGILVLASCLASQVRASDPALIEHWDRNAAIAAANSFEIDPVVNEIGDVSSLSDAAATLSKLKDLESRGDWPLPAREAAIYQFTRDLASLPRDAVAIEVIQHLQQYQPRVLVSHEDHGTVSTPLFNIRGAAAGVENGWQRAEWASTATALIDENPAAMVSEYLGASGHSQRSGLLDALQRADLADVKTVQKVALEQLTTSPELSAVIAATVPITADGFATRQLLIEGSGAGLSSVLEQLDSQLDVGETADLLSFAIEQAPTGNTALAIAAWWPRLSHSAAIRDLMLGLLADPLLGANAALALAQGPDLQTIKALQDIADGDSVAAKRARMALDLNRSELVRKQP